MKKFELAATTQKSYYGKAIVTEIKPGLYQLTSYETIVCEINNGEFIRYWSGYSATTMKHVNDFLRLYGIPGGGKKWWMSQEVKPTNTHITELIIELDKITKKIA